MRYDELFKAITRLCAEMMAAGGSGEMISYRMKCLCKRYGINEAEFMINPGAVLATADALDGMALTAIVPLKSLGQDFGKLQKHFQTSYLLKALESLQEDHYLS